MLEAGSTVHYKLRADWGLGRVQYVYPNGLLLVRFTAVNYEGEFSEGELEDAAPLTVAS